MALLLPAEARGQAMMIAEPPARSQPAVPLELRSHQVKVTIDGQLATTRIEQVFYNSSDALLEGTLLYPLPRDAHVDRFVMDINGEPVQAELLDAAKARGIYEEIVRKVRDPALLEYCEQGLLRA
ncbi:MAG TPA: VIT domain-containing protein, partial [Phycisphaeraceae bacterium]